MLKVLDEQTYKQMKAEFIVKMNIGACYYAMKNFNEAKDYINKALSTNI